MSTKLQRGTAITAHEICQADPNAMVLNLSFPRFAPALRLHAQRLIRSAVERVDTLQGLQRKQMGDVIAEQAGSMATAATLEIAIPERYALILNRP